MSIGEGKLIVIEGLDGSGTSTQARLLVAALQRSGRKASLTKQPSDGPVGRLLREFMAGGHRERREVPDGRTLALLFAADRVDHAQHEVAPRLRSGEIVVSDRWYHSSLAYQGRGSRCELDWVCGINGVERWSIRPDLTLFLQVTPEVAAQRRSDAGRETEIFDDIEVQREVEQGYWRGFRKLSSYGERVEVISGMGPIAEVEDAVRAMVSYRLQIPRMT